MVVGVRVKADVSKICKSAKKVTKLKKKSSEKWKTLNDKVKTEQHTKQQKRECNLNRRRATKRAKTYERWLRKYTFYRSFIFLLTLYIHIYTSFVFV